VAFAGPVPAVAERNSLRALGQTVAPRNASGQVPTGFGGETAARGYAALWAPAKLANEISVSGYAFRRVRRRMRRMMPTRARKLKARKATVDASGTENPMNSCDVTPSGV